MQEKKRLKNKFKMNPSTFGLGVTNGGRLTWDIDDDVAKELRGMEVEDIYSIVAFELYESGFENMSLYFQKWFGKDNLRERWNSLYIENELRERFSRYNPGLQRVWLGALIRKTRLRIITNQALKEAKMKQPPRGRKK